MAQFTFELVTPEKLFLSIPVAMVTVPGGEGDFGVLANHAPMITTVKAGVISVYADNDNTVTERIFVAGGFAEVNGERCTVLAEEAIQVADLDREELLLHAKLLGDSITPAMSDAERARVEAELAIAQAKLAAVTA